MNAKQKKLLESLPVKKHDPDGVTAKMIMQHTGLSRSAASQMMREKIQSGEAVACWVKGDMRFIPAMKVK